jgi:hypothetical protein
MNFLSHGLLVRHTGSAHVLVGSALPDLAPLADRRLRLTEKRLLALEELGAHELVLGCRSHRAVDRAFHHGEPFNTARKAVEATLDVEDRPRSPIPVGMLAHMLVEVGIDAEILLRFPAFARETYPQAFDDYDWPALMALLREVCEHPTDALEDLVGRFDSGAFLMTYETDGGVIDRMAGMATRLGRGPMDEAARAWLAPAVAEARRLGAERFDALMPWQLELSPDSVLTSAREQVTIPAPD